MENKLKLQLTPSPHITLPIKTKNIMLDVIIAMIPALIAGTLLFGWRALLVVVVTVATCVLAEWLWQKALGNRSTIGDLSAVVTGMLLGFNFSAEQPWWQVVLGGIVAIIVFKQFFGGIGFNLVNPAAATRGLLRVVLVAILGNALPFTSQLTQNTPSLIPLPADVFTTATPLNNLAHGLYDKIPYYWQLLVGMRGGSLGETSKVAIVLGAAWLLYKRVISPIIPVTYIATVFVLSAAIGLDPLLSILSGGLFLGAFFMATDYATSPVTTRGKYVFALGLGFLTVLIRQFGFLYEGVAFSIVTMNLLVPLIEKLTKPKAFGVTEAAE